MNPARYLLVATCLLTPAVGSYAEEIVQPTPLADRPASTFQDVVHSYLVNVEVWVSDGKGRPITGLRREDFELREDGAPVEVTHFSEMRGALPATPLAAPEGTPADAVTVAPAVEPDPGHLVLYFDFLHLSTSGTRQMVKDLGQFLDSERFPPSRVLILAQTRKLSTVVPFGSSREQIDQAVVSLGEARTEGIQTERQKRLTLKHLETTWDYIKRLPGSDPCRRFVPQAMAEIENFAWQRTDLVGTTLDFLADVSGYLAALPGLKTLVYLGDQLETTPGRGMIKFIDAVCPPARRDDMGLELTTNLVAQFDRLTAHANTNRVTFYAFQTGGLKPNFLLSADTVSTDFLNSGGQIDAAMRHNERAGLSHLATQTGGRASFNRNRFAKELVAVSEEMGTHYSLAYVPTHGGDGLMHRIDVKVRGGVSRSPGGPPAKQVVVRHRQRYRDKGDDVRMAERIEGVAHLGLVSNPLDVSLGAGSLEPQEDGRFRLPLHVLVPAERATFLPSGSTSTAQLELVATAYDTADQIVSSARSAFQVERPATPEEATLDLLTHVEIGPGRHVVVVGLRDHASREASYVSTAVEVQSP